MQNIPKRYPTEMSARPPARNQHKKLVFVFNREAKSRARAELYIGILYTLQEECERNGWELMISDMDSAERFVRSHPPAQIAGVLHMPESFSWPSDM